MGFFSFITQDSGESIPNAYQSHRSLFRVVMTDNNGRQWIEDNYQGFGVFGGKDYYELLAEINGLETRSQAIEAAYRGGCLFPNLTRSETWTWRNECPKHCPDQGYFYE